MIDKTVELPIAQQCRLVGLNRSAMCYRPRPISPKYLELMCQIDEIPLACPFMEVGIYAMNFGIVVIMLVVIVCGV